MGDKVLIGITSKNRRNILPKSIGSALSQKYEVKEVAVFDDNSSDGTQQLQSAYPEVKWYLSNEDRGYVYARNLFLTDTDAVFFCSLDDDSWFLSEDKLAEAVDYMNANKNVGALAFRIFSPGHDNGNNKPTSPAETNNFIGCGHMLRVSAAREAGMYAVNPGYYGGEEKDLCLSLINKGYRVMWYPDVHVWHDKTNVARNSGRQHRSAVCNDLAFMWRRTPALFLLPAIAQKIYVHFAFPVRYKDLSLYRHMFAGFKDFTKFLLRGKVKRMPVSGTAFKKYLAFNR